MKSPLRFLAVLYAVTILIAAGWAIWTDIALLHSPQEHLVPDMAVFLLSLPASLSLSWVHETWPSFFLGPFTQLAWVAFCGLLQAAILLFASRLVSVRRVRSEA